MARKKRKRSALTKYLFVSIFLVSFIVLFLIYFIDILPRNYFIILFGLFMTINIIFSCLLFSRSNIVSGFGKFFSAVYMILMIIAAIYELNTIDFLKKIGDSEYLTINYNVLVLKDSDYNSIEDIKGVKLGITNSYSEEALTKLSKKVTTPYYKVNNYTTLSDKLIDGSLKAVLLEDSALDIINEENPDFGSRTKIIYEYSVDLKQKEIKNKVNITKEPFNIYVSGIDTYGSVNSVSRSDVNIVMTVVPDEEKIVLTWIPRDYYVKLADKNEYDKLTHAGIYGVETSVSTIEDLLGIKINYYMKLNFSSLIKTVDTFGGITVDSKYSFTSQDGYTFSHGNNTMNGKKALSFVRERKNLPNGDISRGENQLAVLGAIINKATSKAIITKYNSFLKNLKQSFVTNLSDKEITNFIKMQIDKDIKWEIINVTLDGYDGYEYTYSYSKKKLYVMIPNQDAVDNATSMINNYFHE